MPIRDLLAVAKERTIAKLPADVAKGIDPGAWLEILSAIVQLLQICGKNAPGGTPDEAVLALALKSPTMMQQLQLRRAIIRELGSRTAFRQYGDTVLTQLLDVGNATDDELLGFVSQALGK